MRRARTLVACFAIAFAPSTTSCGGDAPPPARSSTEPRAAVWQDVFDGTPEFYVVVRPQALRRDPVYGSFVKSLVRVAEARGDLGGVTTLEAAAGCDEVIIGLTRHASASEGPSEGMAMVLRGVPASLDPAKMKDASGHPAYHVVDARARVQELEPLDARGSLFVLPDRTWVWAIGSTRDRAREAFAHPFGRPVPKADPQALALLRLDAATFLARAQKSPNLGPVLRRLASATLALRPGKNGLVLALQYEDEDAAAWGELQSKRLLEEVARASGAQASPPRPVPKMFALAKDAVVARDGNAVLVKMTIPDTLLQNLPNASPSDLPL